MDPSRSGRETFSKLASLELPTYFPFWAIWGWNKIRKNSLIHITLFVLSLSLHTLLFDFRLVDCSFAPVSHRWEVPSAGKHCRLAVHLAHEAQGRLLSTSGGSNWPTTTPRFEISPIFRKSCVRPVVACWGNKHRV